jgi:hypothetical protein
VWKQLDRPPRSPARPGGPRPRRVAGAAAGLCVVGLAVLSLTSGADGPVAAPPAGPDREIAPVAAVVAAAPGDDPGLQRYLKSRENLQIELVNAAVAVRNLDPRTARRDNRSCARLAAATAALNAFAAAPSAPVDTLTRAGLPALTEAAKACLAGNIPAAIAGVNAGLTERADALNALDDVLDGQ